MAIFTQDFRSASVDTIATFDPSQDVIDFSSVNAGRSIEDFQRGAGTNRARAFNDGKIVDAQGEGVSLAEVNGGTMISAGEGNSLFVANITPDQLGVGNITVDGQAIDVSPDSDLQSILDVIAPTGGVTAVGGDGDDILKGSVGTDTLTGGAGDDLLNSGRGADTLDGGEGNDTLSGGMGDDVIYGGEGNDALGGGQQDDFLDGGAGDDVLSGGAGSDTLDGGAGDDVLDGGARSDVLTGGDGSDTFVQDFSLGGADTITDFNPDQDVVDFRGLDGLTNITVSELFGDTVINAGNGNTLTFQNITPEQLSVENIKIDGVAVTAGANGSDISSLLQDASSTGDNILSGTGSDETLDGAEGRGSDDGFDIRTDALANDSDQTGEDTLEGGAGDDTPAFFTQVRGNFDSANTIRTGGEGDDILEGGMANNTLEGGAGDDTLRGFMGDDYLVGGDGDDTLMGMGSNDVLTGGAGNDTFVQDFRDTGHDIITDFNPSEDRIALNGVQNSFEVSVTAVDGGTLIDSGTGNTLFVANVQPDQLGASNVTIHGEAPTFGPEDTLESVLADVAAELQGDTLNLRGFSDSAYDYMRHVSQAYGPNSPGLLYEYKNNSGNLDIVSGIPAEVAGRISSDLIEQKNNLSVVIVGIDEFWDVALLKFIYEFTASSAAFNANEMRSGGLFEPRNSAGGIPQAAVNQIEEMFKSVRMGGSPETLKSELDKWGVFGFYEDRFLNMFK